MQRRLKQHSPQQTDNLLCYINQQIHKYAIFLTKLSYGIHMKILCILILFLVSGCASIQPVKFNGPTGKTAYSMKCSGMGRTLEQCYVKAGEVCPNGYSI